MTKQLPTDLVFSVKGVQSPYAEKRVPKLELFATLPTVGSNLAFSGLIDSHSVLGYLSSDDQGPYISLVLESSQREVAKAIIVQDWSDRNTTRLELYLNELPRKAFTGEVTLNLSYTLLCRLARKESFMEYFCGDLLKNPSNSIGSM